MEQNKAAEAVPALRRSISLGGDASGYVNLGGALRAVGRLAEAAAALKEATILDPSKASSLYKLGVLPYMDV